MATIDLGKIKLLWRGTYNNGTAYAVDDVVEYTDGSVTSSFICTAASTGNAPSTGGTVHGSWDYIAKGQAVSPTTTQGDIIYRGASADARLAKGTAGQVLKMNSGATAPEWGTDIGGKLIQVQHAVQTTSQNADDSTWDIIVSDDITPASGNKVLLMASSQLGSGAQAEAASFSFFRGSTNLGDGTYGLTGYSKTTDHTSTIRMPLACMFVDDSPGGDGSTAITYSFRFRVTDGNSTDCPAHGAEGCRIILIEIG